MKKCFYLLVFLFTAALLSAAGEAESGRDSMIDMIQSGSYVASSYLDVESVLDDYEFPYTVDPQAPLSVYLDIEKPLVPEWGDTNYLQVSFISNTEEFFAKVDFNYVVFPYSAEFFADAELVRGFENGMRSILRTKSGGQKILFYFRRDNELRELTRASQIGEYLKKAEDQMSTASVRHAVEVVAEAEKDLKMLLEAFSEYKSGLPAKYFWILGKPIANTAKDFRDVSAIIAGYGSSTTEISFCGHGKSFRAQTVNTFVSQFGGNSYYFSDAERLAEIIEDDFAFYSRPAVSDLNIAVYSAGPIPIRNPVREYTMVTIGTDEHHVFLVPFDVPSRQEYEKARLLALSPYETQSRTGSDDTGRGSYPLAYVTVSYFDHKANAYRYEDLFLNIEYTDDFEEFMESSNMLMRKNLMILDTYKLMGSVASQLSYSNYVDPLIDINSHIKRLERWNGVFEDALIAEDIEILGRYKSIILANKGNPLRGLKSIMEIVSKRY